MKGPKKLKKSSLKSVGTLRLGYYENVRSSNGSIVSGFADQFGRLMKIIINEKEVVDYVPAGMTIKAVH
ncbi:MAG: hypothetical protein AABY15_02150 [Nanoarchaeota archaeon]